MKEIRKVVQKLLRGQEAAAGGGGGGGDNFTHIVYEMQMIIHALSSTTVKLSRR